MTGLLAQPKCAGKLGWGMSARIARLSISGDEFA